MATVTPRTLIVYDDLNCPYGPSPRWTTPNSGSTSCPSVLSTTCARRHSTLGHDEGAALTRRVFESGRT